MKKTLFEVEGADIGSAAQRFGICTGDRIVSVNGEELVDYIDYVYFSAQKKLKIKLLRNGKAITVRIRKEEDESLGLDFTAPLLGAKRVCGNKCVFCFVDQLPKGMRKSLYVKDEDWRYSFVMGNYVTLSHIGRDELRRIMRRRVSPLYISVHTVDEQLRKRMIGGQAAIPIRPLLKKFAANGIRFHAQAVVCPAFNDGKQLEETYRFLKKLYPAAMSLAVVPVGLTGFREGLEPIEPVNRDMARETVKMVEKWQQECLNSMGTRFVFAADEYYIRAGLELPAAESYEAFSQLENGVGMMAKLMDEVQGALGKCGGRPLSIATGQAAYPYFLALAEKAKAYGAKLSVYEVKNSTFGGGVTVSGLLGGRDFLASLRDKPLGEAVLITANALRDGEKVFLDDMSLPELSERLGVPVIPITDGIHLASLLMEE